MNNMSYYMLDSEEISKYQWPTDNKSFEIFMPVEGTYMYLT